MDSVLVFCVVLVIFKKRSAAVGSILTANFAAKKEKEMTMSYGIRWVYIFCESNGESVRVTQCH